MAGRIRPAVAHPEIAANLQQSSQHLEQLQKHLTQLAFRQYLFPIG